MVVAAVGGDCGNGSGGGKGDCGSGCGRVVAVMTMVVENG